MSDAPLSQPPFHLAVPVDDLEAARIFYVGHLGCRVGRTSAEWIDFDFWGHQLTVHRVDRGALPVATNRVDGHAVPTRHFGVVLPWPAWRSLGARLEADGLAFLIPPTIRFAGEVGEQGTFFLADPAGNALEFKSFADPARLFAR